MDEFSSAMMTAVKRGDGYILPVLMDKVRVPSDLIHPHIHYLRATDVTPEDLANEFANKLGLAEAQGQEPALIGNVVQEALQYRMPKIVPDSWSKYEELDKIFDYLTAQFKRGAEELRTSGLISTVRQREDHLLIRVERGGQTVAGLDIHRGAQMGDHHITWSVGWRNTSSNSFNGWATPTFDKERGVPTVEISDFNMSRRSDAFDGSYEAFFSLLWDLVIDQVER